MLCILQADSTTRLKTFYCAFVVQAAVIGERTAQGYTGVWVATCCDCWVVGLGSRLFEREVMRAVDSSPPTFSDALRYFVSFRSGSSEGGLEVRDIYAGKSLSLPSAGVRHLLHIRSISRSSNEDTKIDDGDTAQQQRSLRDMSGARATGQNTCDTVNARGKPAIGMPAVHSGAVLDSGGDQSKLQSLKGAVAAIDEGAEVRAIPAELCGAGSVSYMVVCSSSILATQIVAALADGRSMPLVALSGASDVSNQFEARSVLSLLAEGWGVAIGFPMPKLRQQSLCATGVQRLVGRALEAPPARKTPIA